MADQNKDQEKTEEPTARKLRKAKEEGNVSKSQEINSVVLLAISSLTLYFSGSWLYEMIEEMFQKYYGILSQPVMDTSMAVTYWQLTLEYIIAICTPIMIVLFLSAILVNIVQTGPVFTTKVFEPKPDKLDPIKGLGRIFSSKGFVELLKGFSKILAVGIVIYFTVKSDISVFLALPTQPLDTILSEAGRWIVLIVTRILAILILLSIIDAAFQRWKYKQDLKMSMQEVKDEYKQMEGDPKVKSQRKQMAMQQSRKRRMDHAVLNSDVVVTNPTHYAVALRYKPDEQDAPMIMAKGMRKRALKIRAFAEQYDVPIIENAPIARALYAAADEEQFVPPELYQAVAEILAYVYRMNDKAA
jgi:flagellar biosynthetic protein FlhB